MDYQQALAEIHAHKRFGAFPGLDRMRTLLALMGNPQEKLRFVHIAGTNGKGSTAAMLAGILRDAGYRTGLYTSPYIVDFRERMQVNGELIPRDVLTQGVERILPLARQVDDLTEFELVTAVAFDYFAREECEIVVLEVGLGGRFDATNVIACPQVAVIAKIGLDHTEILGDTLEQIAFEKCGIIKLGGITVSYPAQEPDALAEIMEQCALRGNTLITPNLAAAQEIQADIFGSRFTYQGMRIALPLLGAHQIANALTAIEAARVLARQGFAVSAENITRGIAGVRFPARMEVLSHTPLVVLDGAHNPDGAHALADALSLAGNRPVTAVMGVLADKGCDEMLAVLAPRFARMLCVTPENPRALDAHALAARAGKYCPEALAYDSLRAAYDAALMHARRENGMVLVCGSLYLAGDLKRMLEL